MAKCVVLRSSIAYSETHASILRDILASQPDLFAAVGIDCAAWEDAMDWLCIELNLANEGAEVFCNTTAHPNEPLSEVVAFAEQWCDLKGWDRDVEVVNV